MARAFYLISAGRNITTIGGKYQMYCICFNALNLYNPLPILITEHLLANVSPPEPCEQKAIY